MSNPEHSRLGSPEVNPTASTGTAACGPARRGNSGAYRPVGAIRSHDPLRELVFERAEGAHVWDTENKRYLDLICGYSACNLGHAHPALLRALTEQAHQLHFSLGGQSPWRNTLEEDLVRCWDPPCRAQSSTPGVNRQGVATPMEPVSGKAWLCTTGARAVEAAWKISHARRPGGVVRFDLGYHGRSLATGWISDTRRSNAMPALGLETCLLTFPTGCRCHVDIHLEGSCQISPGPLQLTSGGSVGSSLCEACEASLEQAEHVLDRRAQRMSMMILEPVIGSRGYYFAPPTYYQRLVALGRERGLLIVSDEVQMGLRRLGPMLVSQHDGWCADLSVLGKSLGGGLVPIAAVIGEAGLMDGLEEGVESETFAATPLACRLGIEVLKLLEMEPCTSSDAVGQQYRRALRECLPTRMSVRGRGMASVLGLEAWGERGAEVAAAWTRELCRAGILVHLTGLTRSRIALLPPVNLPITSLLDTMPTMQSTLERVLGGTNGE